MTSPEPGYGCHSRPTGNSIPDALTQMNLHVDCWFCNINKAESQLAIQPCDLPHEPTNNRTSTPTANKLCARFLSEILRLKRKLFQNTPENAEPHSFPGNSKRASTNRALDLHAYPHYLVLAPAAGQTRAHRCRIFRPAQGCG